MQLIPTDAKKIKITFVCDLCSVDTTAETDVPSEEISINATCFVCHKNFSIKVTPTAIEVMDIADDDVTIEVI